jgi:DNA-binding SARP family transcriptional activator
MSQEKADSSGTVEVFMLGHCTISIEGQPVPGVPSGFFRIAAYILLSKQSFVSRQHLSSLLWPDAGRLSADFNTVAISKSPNVTCDLGKVLDKLETPEPQGAMEVCTNYGGDLLAELGDSGTEYEDWLLLQRDRLRSDVIGNLERAIASSSRLSPEQRAMCARRLLEIDRCNEAATRLLMVEAARYRQLSRVRSIYDALSRNVMQDLGVQPSRETTALYEDLNRQFSSQTPI